MIPVFSIIIPSYKSDKFIKQCISSVLHQTFDSFEIIIIDDGSPDQTGEICLRIAADYPYVRYIYQEHQGAGAARNKGLRVANGEYVLFLDAFDPNAYFDSADKEGELTVQSNVNTAKAGS